MVGVVDVGAPGRLVEGIGLVEDVAGRELEVVVEAFEPQPDIKMISVVNKTKDRPNLFFMDNSLSKV